MKTLDEVINALEICGHDESPKCPYFDTEHWCCCEDHMRGISPLKNDALQWLKGYKGHIELDKLRDKCEAENDPLTWQELKQMEGKPVWVEAESLSVGVSPYWKDWNIIKSFTNDEFMYCNDGYEWAKETQGRMWQAYRKERG